MEATMANLDELYRNLEGKEHEIAVLYASATGRNIANLSEGERFRLAAEVGELVEEAEEAAFIEDETVEEWRARDERLAATPIGRLMLERHEIEEQILSELEDPNCK
jgi:hypothetical protein